MTCRDVHPGDRVYIQSWLAFNGVPREVTIKFMAENYWMPDSKNKLSYSVIKGIIPKERNIVEAEVMYPASSSTLQIRYKLPKDTKFKYGDKVKIEIIDDK